MTRHLSVVKPRPALHVLTPPDEQTALDAFHAATRRYVDAAISVAEALLRNDADADIELDNYIQARAEQEIAKQAYRQAVHR